MKRIKHRQPKRRHHKDDHRPTEIDYNRELQSRIAANLPTIAKQARSAGLPPDAALVVRFTENTWDVIGTDLETAETIARTIGPELHNAFKMTNLVCAIGLTIPVVAIYYPEHQPGFSTGCTMIHRH